jgi:hypothetical protein
MRMLSPEWSSHLGAQLATMTAATAAIRLACMSTSFLLSHIREKPFATGTAHPSSRHVITPEESNLLDDRVGYGLDRSAGSDARFSAIERSSGRATFDGESPLYG